MRQLLVDLLQATAFVATMFAAFIIYFYMM